MDVKNKIRELCDEKRMPIKTLSENIGMSFSGLYSALNNNSLRVDTLESIAKVLDVSIIDLFDDVSNEHKENIQKLKDVIENKDKEIFELIKEAREDKKIIIGLIEKVGIYEKRGSTNYSRNYLSDLNNIDSLIEEMKKGRVEPNVQAIKDYVKKIKKEL